MLLNLEGAVFGSAFSVKPLYFVGTDYTKVRVHGILAERGINATVKLGNKGDVADGWFRSSSGKPYYKGWNWYTIIFATDDDQNMAILEFGE